VLSASECLCPEGLRGTFFPGCGVLTTAEEVTESSTNQKEENNGIYGNFTKKEIASARVENHAGPVFSVKEAKLMRAEKLESQE